MQVMTPNHPNWEEFCERLDGPEGCDFGLLDPDDDESLTWDCSAKTDKPHARRILREMGFSPADIEASCAFFEQHGEYCDCEILFNVEDNVRRKDGSQLHVYGDGDEEDGWEPLDGDKPIIEQLQRKQRRNR